MRKKQRERVKERRDRKSMRRDRRGGGVREGKRRKEIWEREEIEEEIEEEIGETVIIQDLCTNIDNDEKVEEGEGGRSWQSAFFIM